MQNSLYRQILGIRFYTGSAEQSVTQMQENGGLLVVPAAPALKDLPTHSAYREALLDADLVITDSALMVMVWNMLHRDRIRRVSGLEYLREMLQRPEARFPGNTFWIMASEESASRNLVWLRSQGILVPESHVYMAPMYHGSIDDQALLQRLEELKPKHIVVTVGGGTQERLGKYLKFHLSYRPAIHCIGAAIAFLSGDQVSIPVWADKMGLGWLLRCLSSPGRYVPRYWAARKLVPLLVRYRDQMPPSSDRDKIAAA
ncbi:MULTISPECIES: WecB/TagA/CpsF family glycosyltransferase [Acidobacterium]|uniref:Glycosyl transferaseWecB/TagA/CpsF family n=1 Tax=Acidobacterium capsulatum (strain ATCC 51196 / DSM 11244 / BCRC 80197 / JCM 7670 / NBRC 15755 / NCIMB 13165 / 161) TaxID=240015 RepID=C1F9W8_ACIC5|nr:MULTISPECIES: WecB/TagA/CpsF family glycosyltransferase [Acidobacterium]ACO31995.1 glycosyl transferaseWecB/TagA/CpsF family [Acidobacterium capsulatum ATCC 51196]HCT62108.1 glycosyltransferase [Acidobacterium sp.]